MDDKIGVRDVTSAAPPNQATLSEVAMARHSIYICRACRKEFERPVSINNKDKSYCSIGCRFWAKVDKSNGPDSCWIWIGTKRPLGYGVFRIDGHTVRAHRLAYEFTIGPIGDLHACHKCDNPSCVNPSHIFLGTHLDNMRDMFAKNRRPIARNRYTKIRAAT